MTISDKICNITFLDLNKVDLYGWESAKSDLVINSIFCGALARDNFPPVPVVKISEKIYQLDSRVGKCYEINGNDEFICDGGHKRSVGHYIANVPLKVIITRNFFKLTVDVNIKNIELIDDQDAILYSTVDYKLIKKIFPDYR
jgi:hypothetical protein